MHHVDCFQLKCVGHIERRNDGCRGGYRFVDKRLDAARAGLRGCYFSEGKREKSERPHQQIEQTEQACDLTDRCGAGPHPVRPEQQDQHLNNWQHDFLPELVEHPDSAFANLCAHHRRDVLMNTRSDSLFQSERLDDPEPIDHLVHRASEFRQLLLHRSGRCVDSPLKQVVGKRKTRQ